MAAEGGKAGDAADPLVHGGDVVGDDGGCRLAGDGAKDVVGPTSCASRTRSTSSTRSNSNSTSSACAPPRSLATSPAACRRTRRTPPPPRPPPRSHTPHLLLPRRIRRVHRPPPRHHPHRLHHRLLRLPCHPPAPPRPLPHLRPQTILNAASARMLRVSYGVM